MISRLNGPLNLGGMSVSPSSLYAGYAGASLILLLFSGATGAIFWIIGMFIRCVYGHGGLLEQSFIHDVAFLGAAAIIILGHAALLEPGLEGEFGADSQV